MTLMTDLDSSWLKIDEQPISLKQAVGYLQLFGRLRPFLQEIVSQHVIYQEIQERDDLEISTAEREQAAIDPFCSVTWSNRKAPVEFLTGQCL